MSDHKITAMVTGASAGLGAQYCRQLAERCEVIIAVARRGERLAELARELHGQVEVHAVVADLTTIEGVARAMEALRQQGPVDYLVNNAGFSTAGEFADQVIDSQYDMVSLHINATLALCRTAIPFMAELGGGYIINVASIAAFLPGGGMAVYGASKAFLNHFSTALQAEVAASGIKVQSLCPGHTRTEFHDTAALSGFDKSTVPNELWMEADAVVTASLQALATEQVVVVGERSRPVCRKGLQQQLDAMEL
ncbi:MAG: SDR family oxidoreductase [Halieaceae bacterium]|jgi:uncharacterized protein|nr:SDR family oxidoreductase [Halieaceae bacterium]